MLKTYVARSVLVCIAVGAMWRTAHGGLVFNFTSTGNAQADSAFAAAGARWSNLLKDNITVNVTAGFTALGPGILGETDFTAANYSYTSVRNALIGDKTSGDDITATSHLQAAPALKLYLNRTSNNPNGSGSATPYLDNDGDANNNSLFVTNANAKALGLLPANNMATDADITFSTSFPFDFDPSNGIAPGTFDFVGIATHELGHALGFFSGVDVLDNNSTPPHGPFADNVLDYVSTLDLYRYSLASVSNGALDWTADSRTKYFSLDGGVTSITTFSTGVHYGDATHRQASHWKDTLVMGPSIGIMDPTVDYGELLAITPVDIQAFDVIGYNLPEPSALVLMGLGSLALSGFACRRSSKPRHS